ncbi:MAG: DUF1815 family protein [Synechococcus sp.]|nr:DUF1815 family protein [Synechococcus sp.]
MFPRLAEQYRTLVHDLVMSLQALAHSLQERGCVATCYVCGDGRDGHGASFVADLGDNHTVRFLVSDFGITWVESRDGHELVKFEGAEAIQELQRVAQILQQPAPAPLHSGRAPGASRSGRRSHRLSAPLAADSIEAAA